eukprot:Tamp_20413.p2 GENE.Tamp_20413~~Tamp_20413.p2  ORF type:complete len:104 (+),score=10.12 Tamp_20413:170-481(+)
MKNTGVYKKYWCVYQYFLSSDDDGGEHVRELLVRVWKILVCIKNTGVHKKILVCKGAQKKYYSCQDDDGARITGACMKILVCIKNTAPKKNKKNEKILPVSGR